MPIQPTVIPSNLGTEFDLGVIEANKIRVKLAPNTLIKNALNELEVRDTVRIVNASGLLLASDRVVLVQNGGGAVTLTIPTTVFDITISRSRNSTGAVTIIFAGGAIESLAGGMGASTTLAAVGAFGSASRFVRNPLDATQMLRVRI